MKKKFVLILALVLMVAVGLSAATPLTVGGTFETGYEFKFASANSIKGTAITTEAKNAAVSVAGDFWKVSLAGGDIAFDANMAATAEIYMDKALAAQGVDMGDLTLTMAIGNKTTLGGLSVYSNSRDDLGDYKLVMNSGDTTGYSSTLTIGYGSLVTVMVGADIAAMDTANKAFVIGAKTTPVEGVSLGVSYTNLSNDVAKVYNSADGAIDGSVKVDVAALAGIEDFGLTLSAYDAYFIESKENNLYLELNGSYEDFSAWTEYRIRDKRNDMKLSVSYAGIENVGLSASVALDDITKVTLPKMETTIGAGITYGLGGVTYALDASYGVVAEAFTLTPTVKIAF